MSINKTYLGYNAERLETAPAFAPYSKVIAWYDDENAFVSGDDSGRVLEVDLPFATQEIVNGMLERIRGYAYQPWAGTRAILDPAAELGDGVTINGVYSVLASTETTFDGLMLSDAEAPADEEVDHEYPYIAPTTREVKRNMKRTRSMIEKTNEKIELSVEGLINEEQAKSLIKQQMDSIELSVSSKEGSTTLELTAGGAQLSAQTLDISVKALNIEGKITADQLNITGAITFGDLDESTQQEINGKLNKSAMPSYLHKTYIDETEIYSPSIYGGTLYATDDSDLYARMTVDAFELMRDGDNVPRAALSAYSNLVELALGVGTDDTGDNGRMYIRKSYGSVNGSDTQNFGLVQYRNTDGQDSGLLLLDDGSVTLSAAPGGNFSLNGNYCQVYTDDNGIVFDAGPVIMRLDNNNMRVNFYFKYNDDMDKVDKTWFLDASGLHT